jgi:uncharacterized GH25 family protein
MGLKRRIVSGILDQPLKDGKWSPPPMIRRLLELTVGLALLAPFSSLAATPIPVTGSVTTVGGAPVARARVGLVPFQSSHAWGRMTLAGRAYAEPAVSTETDAAGRFALAGPESGLWVVVVEKPGFLPVQYSPLPLVEETDLPPAVLIESAGARFQAPGDAAGAWVFAASETPAALRPANARGWSVRPRLGRVPEGGALELPRARGEKLTVQVVRAGMAVKRTGLEGGALSAPAAGGPRTIEVRDSTGKPVPDVHARAADLQAPVAVTGPDGRAILSVPSGPVRLRLLAEDGRRWAGTLGPEGPFVLTLPPPAPLAGRVIDAVSRRPLAGALVWLSPDPGAFARTDVNGQYRLAALEADASHLQAEAAGHLPLAQRFRWKSGGSQRGPSLSLDPASSLAGIVVDAAGKPLPGAQVQAVARSAVRQRTFARSGTPERRAAAGPDGRFRLGKLLAGEAWQVRATHPGFAPSRLTLPPLEKSRSDLRLVLGRGRTAFGRVIDRAEKPVPGAEVSLLANPDSWDTATGPEGGFEVRALPAGPVDLRVRKSGFVPVLVRAIPIPGGEGPFNLGMVILEPGVILRGLVTDREGRPVSGAEVHRVPDLLRAEIAARAGALSREPDASTGVDGRFEIPDLRRGDRVNLFVRASGYAPGSLGGVTVPPAKPVRVVLDRGARVAGRVVDPEDRPVVGANIELLSHRPGEERGLIRRAGTSLSAQSDADGRFAFEGVTPGAADLSVTAEAFQPAKLADLPVPARGVEDLKVVLERGAVIEGRVLTAAGDPVEDGRVTCGNAASVSDADGAYRLEGVPSGPQTVRLLHRDYLPFDKKLNVQPGTNPLDLILPGGHEVSGRVVDRAGEGISGAELSLFPPGSPRERDAVSGADGSFRFANVEDGTWSIRAAKEGYVPAESEAAVRVAGAPVRDLVVRLDKGAKIAGRLLGLDLYDLAEVEVSAQRDEESREWRARIDYEGRYEVADLPPGDWVVRGSLRNGAREATGRAVLPPGAEEATVDLEFGRNLTLTGRVLFGGEPLPGALVTLRGHDVASARQVTTDFEGSFRVEDLKPGSYRLQVVSQRESLNHSEELRLDADREIVVEIAASRVSGTVVDAGSGAPIEAAVVALRRLEGEEAAFMVASGTDDDGYFALPNITEGVYRMTVTRDGYAPDERRVDVHAGANLQEMTIPLKPADGLDLEVALASGGRPPYVTAAVLDGSGRLVLFETRAVDGSGRARFPSVPAGSWELLLTAPEGAPTSLRVEAPGPPVPVILPPGGRLTVRVPALATTDQVAVLTVRGANGTPFRNLSPYGTIQSQFNVTGGRAVVENLPAGAWSLTVTAPDGRTFTGAVSTGGVDAEASLN